MRVHLIIRGRVQGVFFRQSTRTVALDLGLRGWVRNRTSGEVEMVAEGSRDRIETLVAWCHRGPDAAQVVDVERIDTEPAGLPEGFHVRPTQ